MSENSSDRARTVPRPVVVNGRVYMKGGFDGTAVWEYTPENDCCKELEAGFSEHFTLTKLDEQLVLITGHCHANKGSISRIHPIEVWVWGGHFGEWDNPYPVCPLKSRNSPAAIAYQESLILAGGVTGKHYGNEVLILNCQKRNWYFGTSLPVVDRYNPVLVDDTLYLVGCEQGNVLRTCLSTPVNPSLVWERLADVPVPNYSSIATSENVILTFGQGMVHMFNTYTNQWAKIGGFLTDCYSCTLLPSGEVLAVGKFNVVISKLNVQSRNAKPELSSTKKTFRSIFSRSKN